MRAILERARIRPAGTARLGRPGGDAGATLVEYALIVALVVVVSLGAIQWMTDSGTDELEDRGGRVGAPDVDAAATTSLPTIPPPVGGGDDDPATPGPQVATLSSVQGCTRLHGNTWLARFTFTVTNSSTGQPIEGALISYELKIRRGNGSEIVETPSAPAPSIEGGLVVITRDELKDSGNPKDVSITLTITGVGGPGPITADLLPEPVAVDKSGSTTCT